MKEKRKQYEKLKAQVNFETKAKNAAIQRSFDRILNHDINYAVKSVRDLAMTKALRGLGSEILHPKNMEAHTANNKLYFKNPATNWYICWDTVWHYSTVREDTGERFEWHPYFDLEGNRGDGKDKRFHFWNTQKDKNTAFEKKASLL